MDGLTYWWRRFRALRALLKDYKQENQPPGEKWDVEECVKHLLKEKEDGNVLSEIIGPPTDVCDGGEAG